MCRAAHPPSCCRVRQSVVLHAALSIPLRPPPPSLSLSLCLFAALLSLQRFCRESFELDRLSFCLAARAFLARATEALSLSAAAAAAGGGTFPPPPPVMAAARALFYRFLSAGQAPQDIGAPASAVRALADALGCDVGASDGGASSAAAARAGAKEGGGAPPERARRPLVPFALALDLLRDLVAAQREALVGEVWRAFEASALMKAWRVTVLARLGPAAAAAGAGSSSGSLGGERSRGAGGRGGGGGGGGGGSNRRSPARPTSTLRHGQVPQGN